MESSNNTSSAPSGTSTPDTRFTSQASTAADLLASQTVGLVHLSDFRKRRAEALEQRDRQNGSLDRFAPAAASASRVKNENSNHVTGDSIPQGPLPKKKRRNVAKGKLSFGVDAEDHDDEEESQKGVATVASGDSTPDSIVSATKSPSSQNGLTVERRRFGANANLGVAPKAMTKSALLREAQTREQLRKEFLSMQEAVKATEIIIPFVFYDGTNIPGGACKVKKGDHAWLFLDRSRKVGAQLGVGGGEKAKSRNEWARVGVDDLMLVRGEIIIPHHYEIYYFIVNKVLGPSSRPLFDYASSVIEDLIQTPRSSSPDTDSYDPISRPSTTKQPNSGQVTAADRIYEGADDDPNFTKVVDRRWYERNKHIFPASVWEEFDPSKNYTQGGRKDAEGNAFFFT